MRAIALIGMVLCHYPIYLSSPEEGQRALYFVSNHVLGDFPASWFVFLVGVSMVLSNHNRQIPRHDFRRQLVRGGVLFIYGLLFLFLIQGADNLWIWDILTFIAAATIVLGWCRSLPSWAIAILSLGVLFITPWLRSLTPLSTFYGGGFEPVDWITDYFPNLIFDPLTEYQPTGHPRDIILGFLYGAEFPFLPWIIFPLIGLIVGRRLVANKIKKDAPILLFLGTFLTIFGLGNAKLGANLPPIDVSTELITPLSFYPLSTSMNLMLLGIIMLVFTSLWYLYDYQPLRSRFLQGSMAYFRQISKYSLTIYITHFCLFFIPLRFTHFVTGDNYLYALFSTRTALITAAILMVVYYPILVQWDKIGGKYSFEWFLNQTVKLILQLLPAVPKAPSS